MDGISKEDSEFERIKSLFPEDFYQTLATMPKNKKDVEMMYHLLPGFPSTQGLSDEEIRGEIIVYWNDKNRIKNLFPEDFYQKLAWMPKDKKDVEKMYHLLPGFPNTQGLSDGDIRSEIIVYWNDRKRKKEEQLKIPAVPKDLSLYPGFPNILGLPKEEADKAVKHFWAQREKNRPIFPMGFWKDPTALIPKDKSCYPDFPNIKGLSKEQADSSIIEFWRKIKAKRDQSDKNRRELLQSRKTVFPPGFWKDPTALMPKDKSQYPDFPNIEGLPKDEADCSIIEFWKKFKEKKDQQKQGRKDTRNGRKMEFIEKFKK